MTKKLLSTVLLLLCVGFASAQIDSLGIIGTATPGQWDVDTDMVQDPDSADLWTLTITLTDGVMKFRTNNDWAVNWGATSFPLGTGEQDGPDIPIVGGEYLIEFNSATGEYYLENLDSNIGLIGSSAPFEWGRDVNMIPDTAGDANKFFITLDLVMGAAKFRQDDDWPVNWGAGDFPEGVGVQDGADIPIPRDGNYTVMFDSASGEYSFLENLSFTEVGIFGDATPNGWDSVTAMIQNPNDANLWSLSLELMDGGLQFIGNGEVIWGADGFPTDTAMVDGDTIPIPAGNWLIDFSTETGIYTFTLIQIFSTVGIIGDATPGGWDVDTDLIRSETDSSQWSLRLELVEGEAKFRAEDDWPINWGAGDFPSGKAIRDGANIPVPAGEYIVDFNSISGEYNFQLLVVYDTVGLIGTGTPFGNWDDDVLMEKDPENENRWTLTEVELTQDGEIKFRVDLDWGTNWGSADWPAGVGTQDGDNIVVATGGTYGVVLNSITGEYAFGDPLTTSNKELLDPSAIKVYPNPARDILNVDVSAIPLTDKFEVNVFDMKGSQVLSKTYSPTQQIQLDATQLPNGIYTLQIRSGKYLVGKKIMVAAPR